MQQVPEPPFRCETRQAIDKLASDLNLPNEPGMQDWPLQAGKPADIEQYIRHYLTLTDEDERFTLMEVIIHSVNYQERVNDFFKYWGLVRPLLQANFQLHQYSVWDWADFDSDDLRYSFLIAPHMRELWEKNYSVVSNNL